MELPAGVIRKRVNHREAGRPEADRQPGRGVGFLKDRGETGLEGRLEVRLPAGLGIEPDEESLGPNPPTEDGVERAQTGSQEPGRTEEACTTGTSPCGLSS